MPAPITPEAAKRLWDQGERIAFVDARTAVAWGTASKRLPAAIRVPVDDVDASAREIPRDALIVTYCSCPREESSVRLAQALVDRGFQSVKYMNGGIDAWQRAGYPLADKADKSVHMVDEASLESFPASDPPAFTPVAGAVPTDTVLEPSETSDKHA